MPDVLGWVMWPFKWAIEAILVGWHWVLTAAGLDPAAGLTWVLAILGLVVVVRGALIPLFVRQIKSQRKMLEVAPDLQKIQAKYKGKRDTYSMQAMQRETQELYARAGTSPFASCLPLLVQMPIFFGLFTVLNEANRGNAGVGLLTQALATQFGKASLFDTAPLHDSIQSAAAKDPVEVTVIVIAVVMVILMTASQFITQLQIMSKNQAPEMKASPMYRQQRILLYVLPLVFAFSGFAFPIGVMFYWLFSNAWTMAQQFIVIRNMPTPGSQAALAKEARLAKRNRAKAVRDADERRVGMARDANALAAGAEGEAAVAVPKPPAPRQSAQRAQPTGKKRAKKRSGGRP